MTLPFKAVAVDMDGTFLDERNQFNHQEFAQILSEFEKRGIKFIIASGRPYARLSQDFDEFADRLCFVTLNGARLLVSGKEVASFTLSRQDALDLINEVQNKYGKKPIMVFETNTAYLNSEIDKQERDFLAYFAGNSAVIDDWKDLPDNNIYQVTFTIENSTVADIETEFNKLHDNKISAFASTNMTVDVNLQGVNKGTGLKKLLEIMNLTGEDLIAFGDGGNDIAMLDFAKYSYAMANGMEKVKQHAKYLAPANTENGVFKVLQKYLNEDK